MLDRLLACPDRDEEKIQEARANLDAKKIANRSSESDCYKSAESSLKHAMDAVDTLTTGIQATTDEIVALQEKHAKQETDLVAAITAKDAAQKRLSERVASISTHAPGVLQPSDVLKMANAMQKLDAVARAAYTRGRSDKGPGHVTNDQMQQIMECVWELFTAAPRTVFSETATVVAQAPSTTMA